MTKKENIIYPQFNPKNQHFYPISVYFQRKTFIAAAERPFEYLLLLMLQMTGLRYCSNQWAVEKWAWPSDRGAPQNLGFPFNISGMAEASDCKILVEVGFDKAHHKTTPTRESALGLELGELPKMWGFPFNIYAET